MKHTDAARKIADLCACMRVRQASRVMSRLYDERLKPTGLQASQLTMLVALALFGEQGAGMGKLAEVVVMDRTTLSRNLKPLEKAGLLRVARSPSDARARVVLLTRAGERAIEAAVPLWEAAQAEVHELLGRREAQELHQGLGELVARLGRARLGS